MKYNIVVLFIVILFIMSCEPSKDRELTPEEEWNFVVKLKEGGGFKVLSVPDSEQWLNENRSKITMPTTLTFGMEHLVLEQPFLQQLTVITVDHNGKYRVVAKGFDYPSPPPDPPPGYLSVDESKKWLNEHGYQLEKITDGYRVKKDRPGLKINMTLKGSGTSVNGLREGVELMHKNGKIYISK